MIVETKLLFIGNEEFEYVVKEENGKFVGSTSFDNRLSASGTSLQEVYNVLNDKLKQLTKAS
jgi:hypothetical protein